MKNFLDLLDINTDILIKVHLEPIVHAGVPSVTLRINGQEIYNGDLDHELISEHRTYIRSAVCVEVCMTGKNYRPDLETAVIIKQLSCNGFEVIPDHCHRATYDNDRGFLAPTHYLGFNGTWKFDTYAPFYEWRHTITNQGWLLSPHLSG